MLRVSVGRPLRASSVDHEPRHGIGRAGAALLRCTVNELAVSFGTANRTQTPGRSCCKVASTRLAEVSATPVWVADDFPAATVRTPLRLKAAVPDTTSASPPAVVSASTPAPAPRTHPPAAPTPAAPRAGKPRGTGGALSAGTLFGEVLSRRAPRPG